MKWGFFMSILIIFLSIGTILPFINEEYHTDATENELDSIEEPEEGGALTYGGNILEILLSVVSMFFWTFGALPLWLDVIFVFFRIVFLILLIDLVLP